VPDDVFEEALADPTRPPPASSRGKR